MKKSWNSFRIHDAYSLNICRYKCLALCWFGWSKERKHSKTNFALHDPSEDFSDLNLTKKKFGFCTPGIKDLVCINIK